MKKGDTLTFIFKHPKNLRDDIVPISTYIGIYQGKEQDYKGRLLIKLTEIKYLNSKGKTKIVTYNDDCDHKMYLKPELIVG